MKLTLINNLSFIGNIDSLLDYLQNMQDKLAEVHYNYCKDCGRQGLECNCDRVLQDA